MRILKKPVLAATISLVAFSAVVVAQADEVKDSLGPKFYGKFHVTMDLQKNDNTIDPTKDEPSHWALNSRSSRVGVQQDIPLNEDITAFYKLEVGVEVDDGDKSGQSFSQRDVYLGIKGDYGQLQAGRFSTPLRKTEGKIEAFNSLRGDIDAVLGAQSRVSNIVQYSSPKFADTVINLAFMPGENEVDSVGVNQTRLANAYSAAVVYGAGNLYAALALGKNLESKTATEVDERSDRIQLAAKYQLGNAAFGAIVQHAEDSNNSELKENAFIINTTYRIEAYTLKAQYGLNKGDSTSNKRTLAAVGVDYKLTDKAFVGLNYAALDIEKGVNESKERELSFGYSQAF